MNFKKCTFTNSGVIASTLGCVAISLSLFLVACGDDSSSNSNGTEIETVESMKDLGECNEENEGQMFRVPRDTIYDTYACEDGKWIPDWGGDDDDDICPVVIDSVVDARDGKTYKTVKICSQTWMAENLNYDYNEGTAKSYCYDNDPDNCTKYGRLYLWSAAMDSAGIFGKKGKKCGYGTECNPSGTIRGVCPEGWHLPSKDEWKKLNAVPGPVVDSWVGDLESYGFSTLAAGKYYEGEFSSKGSDAFFWSSSENYSFSYYYRLSGDNTYLSSDDKGNAFSVRCVKN